MDPQPSESALSPQSQVVSSSGRQLESGHPRADIREEVLKFLVHAVGGCRVCAPISGNNVEHVGEFLVRLHPNDQEVSQNVDDFMKMLFSIGERASESGPQMDLFN